MEEENTFYTIHYTVTDAKTNKDIKDKMAYVKYPSDVMEGIKIFITDHPEYDYEGATRIMKQVSPSIKWALVADEGDKKYYLIIHKLYKKDP